jgi:hypothetical protein
VLILPKLLFGRAFTDITTRIQRPWIPRKLRSRITHFLTWLAHGDITRLGFKRPTELTQATSNATVVTDIAYRRIEVKQGISAVEGKTLRFADGSAEDFDVLIAATGYAIDLDFVPEHVLKVTDNQLDLYMRIVPPAWHGLYFMGFFNTDTALNMVFEHQSRWVRELLLKNASLRPETEMRQAIVERTAWYAGQYKQSIRLSVEEEHVRYLTGLRDTLKTIVKQRHAGTWPGGLSCAMSKGLSSPSHAGAHELALWIDDCGVDGAGDALSRHLLRICSYPEPMHSR